MGSKGSCRNIFTVIVWDLYCWRLGKTRAEMIRKIEDGVCDSRYRRDRKWGQCSLDVVCACVHQREVCTKLMGGAVSKCCLYSKLKGHRQHHAWTTDLERQQGEMCLAPWWCRSKITERLECQRRKQTVDLGRKRRGILADRPGLIHGERLKSRFTHRRPLYLSHPHPKPFSHIYNDTHILSLSRTKTQAHTHYNTLVMFLL